MTDAPGIRPGRRAFIAGGTIALAALAGQAAIPRQQDPTIRIEDLEKIIPHRIGAWHFRSRSDVIVTRETVPIEGYNQLLTRSYVRDDGLQMMMLIAYGATQGGGLQLHRPETCYPGEGFRISALEPETIAIDGGRAIAARSFTARRDNRVEQVLYWTRIGHRFPRTTSEEYLAIIEQVLRGVVPDGTLVRISMIDRDTTRSSRLMREFTNEMLQAVAPRSRSILLG